MQILELPLSLERSLILAPSNVRAGVMLVNLSNITPVILTLGSNITLSIFLIIVSSNPLCDIILILLELFMEL